MQAIFYQITKRSNSTKLPTGGRTFEINLKSPCTIIDPEIKIATEFLSTLSLRRATAAAN